MFRFQSVEMFRFQPVEMFKFQSVEMFRFQPVEIFKFQSVEMFRFQSVEIFKFQFENNKVYRSFCDLLYVHPSDINTIQDIPFLPIQFFKTHPVISSKESIQTTFTSSGTTGSTTSNHFVTDLTIYEASFKKGFEVFYGDIKD